ncbi:MAG: rod shape-determining protein MreD [Anaerolineae bacterium]|jgi:rod shape-determining protein MreD
MTPYLYTAILAAIVIAQSTLMPAAALGQTKPFLPLIAVVCWALFRGPVPGAWWAVAAGLMLDAVSPAPMGFYTLPLLAAVLVVSMGRGRFFATNMLIPWLLVAVATAAFIVAQRSLIPLAGGELDWDAAVITREILPEAALNLLWLPVLYLPLRALARSVAGPRIEWET